MKTAVVIGATGDVGRGVSMALHGAGYGIVAVGRSRVTLDALRQELAIPDLAVLAGSVGTAAEAARLAEDITATAPRPDVVAVTVNGTTTQTPLLELGAPELDRVLRENVSPHVIAANALIPIVAEGGAYVGIGGGMADNVFPGMAAISMAQAAQRVFYRYLAREPTYAGVNVRELMLYSMIAGRSKAEVAEPHWITAEEVGRHLVAILSDLDAFAGPILTLKSRKQIGLPEKVPDR